MPSAQCCDGACETREKESMQDCWGLREGSKEPSETYFANFNSLSSRQSDLAPGIAPDTANAEYTIGA